MAGKLLWLFNRELLNFKLKSICNFGSKIILFQSPSIGLVFTIYLEHHIILLMIYYRDYYSVQKYSGLEFFRVYIKKYFLNENYRVPIYGYVRRDMYNSMTFFFLS